MRIFVLSALVRKGSSNGQGYIEGQIIRDSLKTIGFSETDTLAILKDLCTLRFAHTKSHGKADINSSYFASRLGGHIIKSLIGDFTFIENILMDTFISEKDQWEQLKSISSSIQEERDIVRKINQRIDRIKIFMN